MRRQIKDRVVHKFRDNFLTTEKITAFSATGDSFVIIFRAKTRKAAAASLLRASPRTLHEKTPHFPALPHSHPAPGRHIAGLG
jgi:hypothetical protein